MIGQKSLIKQLNKLIELNAYPRFSILVGSQGSGKKTLADLVAHKLAKNVVIAENTSMDVLKELIDMSYSIIDRTVFIVRDIDDMSVAAKNSLLKVLEEPPNNVYWILTLNNIDNTLNTIKSRATIYNMEPYSAEELLQYADKYDLTEDEQQIIIKVCETPGDINLLHEVNIEKFEQFVQLVVDHIETVSGANSFKIAEKLQTKKDGEGYELGLFWNAVKSECINRCKQATKDHDYYNLVKYSRGVAITNEFQCELGINGVNKQFLLDDWILTIRKAWM